MNALYEYYIANPDASWEKLLRTNIGIDGRFFSERLNVSIDVFYDQRYDILTKVNVPEYFGILSDTNINQGKTSNRGVEISLDWSDRIGEFSYYVNPIFLVRPQQDHQHERSPDRLRIPAPDRPSYRNVQRAASRRAVPVMGRNQRSRAP